MIRQIVTSVEKPGHIGRDSLWRRLMNLVLVTLNLRYLVECHRWKCSAGSRKYLQYGRWGQVNNLKVQVEHS